MIQRKHWPLPTWTGKAYVATNVIVGQDVDCGGGAVGIMPRRHPGGQLAKPDTRKGPKR